MRRAKSKKEHALAIPQPRWSDPDLAPDQFLYGRLGPWPQPAAAYPETMAPEVLNIPPIETLLWNNSIGMRYLEAQLGYPPEAARIAQVGLTRPIPSDDEFVSMMTNSVYARFLRLVAGEGYDWACNFAPMALIDPLPDTHCAPVQCNFKRSGPGEGKFSCVSIEFLKSATNPKAMTVKRGDPAWNLAKVYALQGAAYQALFVVHPALHFPMDSVNAITKTAVPHTHPLFQILYPHTTYTLALDNAVQEGPNSVVSNNAPGTWFDPLTANAYNVKQLFGVGYTGLKGAADFYPPYDYMTPWMDTSLAYGRCLRLYYTAFEEFCSTVSSAILKADPADTYVRRWARHNSIYVRGFPDEDAIFQGPNLARTMAIYMWDVTVSHGADHYSFANDIPVEYKFLRIRRRAPTSKDEGGDVKSVGDVCVADDMARAALAQFMFFRAWTMQPNLIDTQYAFTDTALGTAADSFHARLKAVAQKVAKDAPGFMPLLATDPALYPNTIPASIQY